MNNKRIPAVTGPETLYRMAPDERSNKGGDHAGGIVYPKSAQLPCGRIIMTFERAVGSPVGESLWVYASDDEGVTWRKISEVRPPAELTDDPRYARYISNWTNPYLYVLPERVGDLEIGTLLLASVVSGDDWYYREQKAVNGDAWYNDSDGDRSDMAIVLFSSIDDGETWSVENVIAEGSWQGGSARAIGERFSSRNVNHQVDPVWEPYLMVYDGQLVCYYSDENEYDIIDEHGVMREISDNDTAADPGGQVLVHRLWNGHHTESWSDPVVDEAGTRFLDGACGDGRPGMTNVVPTTDGKWMITYEWWGGGDDVQYKIADSPLAFGEIRQRGITELPNEGGTLACGGSPVLLRMDDGAIVYNACGSGDIWVNRSGRSDGVWVRAATSLEGGFSRNLMQIAGTSRILLLRADFSGADVQFGTVDLDPILSVSAG